MKEKLLIIMKGFVTFFCLSVDYACISNMIDKGLIIGDIILIIIATVIAILLVKSIKSNIRFLSSEEYNNIKEKRRLEKEEKARIKAQEEKEKMDNLISMLENETDPMNKLYIIRDSKIFPYYSHADKAIRKVGDIDLRLKKINLLKQSYFLTNDDVDILTPIFRQEYSNHLKVMREREEARNQRKEQNVSKKIKSNSNIKSKSNYKIIKCPNCNGAHIQILDNRTMKTTLNMNPLKPFTVYNHKEVKKTKKKVSKGKIIAGIATGGTSVLVTGARKKVEVDSYFCMDCGCQWEQ